MIMSRYRYRRITFALPWLAVDHRYGPFTTVTERYQPLLTVTESYRYLRFKRYKRYKRYINFFNKTLNICTKPTLLRSLVTQVTVKFGNGQ